MAAPSSPVRVALVALLDAGPLALALVFGLVKDVPANWSCGDTATPDAEIDAYRSGAWWLIAVSEVAAISLYVLALRHLAADPGQGVAITTAVAGCGVGVAAGIALASSHVAEGGWAAVAFGVAVGIPAWVAFRVLGGREPTWLGLLGTAGLVAGAAIPGFVVVLFAVYAPAYVVVPLVLLSGGMLVWLAARLGEAPRVAWQSLSVATLWFAVAVVPLAGLIVLSRGHGPFIC